MAELLTNTRFRLERQLGVGGMGVVYEAFDRERGVRVALKTLRDFGPQALLRFKKEFRFLHDLQHPNLVSYGELFEDEGQWYFTMELVDGPNLIDFIRGTEGAHAGGATRAYPGSWAAELATEDTLRPSPAQRLWEGQPGGVHFEEARLRSAFFQLGRALAALHAHGVLHRDIKPSNILVTSSNRVVLLDFGLATEF